MPAPRRSVLLLIFGAATASASPSPITDVLEQFTGPDVPAVGPAEAKDERASVRSWPDPSPIDATAPGPGLAAHPMLYAGEGYNVLLLVKDGKVVWSYDTGKGGE